MRLPSTTALLVLALLGAVLGSSMITFAQERGAARRETTAPDVEESEDDSTEAQSELVEEGDGKVKVIKFSGLDISGRLKSPQLLYFLNRLRAEFSRPRLPHRSFMPELQRSTKGKAF